MAIDGDFATERAVRAIARALHRQRERLQAAVGDDATRIEGRRIELHRPWQRVGLAERAVERGHARFGQRERELGLAAIARAVERAGVIDLADAPAERGGAATRV